LGIYDIDMTEVCKLWLSPWHTSLDGCQECPSSWLLPRFVILSCAIFQYEKSCTRNPPRFLFGNLSVDAA